MIQWWRDRSFTSVFWALTPCRVVYWHWHLGRMYCLQFQNERIVSRVFWCDTRKGHSQLHRYIAGLHNLLRNNLSSWFMSPSCSLISVTSRISKSIHLDYLARILAFFRRIRWPKSVMFCHSQNLWFVQSAMVVVFINPDIEAKTSSSQSQLSTSVGFLLPPGASILSVGKKIKFTLEQAMKTQRGSRGIALLFL